MMEPGRKGGFLAFLIVAMMLISRGIRCRKMRIVAIFIVYFFFNAQGLSEAGVDEGD